MAKRPVIGIPMRIEIASDRFYLSRHYSEAVAAAGGCPLHISLIPDSEYIESVVETLDGVLLPGSDSDIDPLRYGQEPHRSLGAVHPLKDQTDLLLIEAAERRNLPILAICFGMQAVNVARGGTLLQDIGALVPNAIKHDQGVPRDRPSHKVAIASESRLAKLSSIDVVSVNSHHHQAVDEIGRDLVAVSWTSDGLIEALEDPRADRFVVAVQWHPELGWQQDAFSQSLFKLFIDRASQQSNVLEPAITTLSEQFT